MYISHVLSLPFSGVLLYVPVSSGKYRLGGSALAQCYGQLGDCSPDLDQPDKLSACFNTTQTLIQGQYVLFKLIFYFILYFYRLIAPSFFYRSSNAVKKKTSINWSRNSVYSSQTLLPVFVDSLEVQQHLISVQSVGLNFKLQINCWLLDMMSVMEGLFPVCWRWPLQGIMGWKWTCL